MNKTKILILLILGLSIIIKNNTLFCNDLNSLSYYVRDQCYNGVKKILEKGVNPDSIINGFRGYKTALQVAVSTGNIDIVQLLIKYNANINKGEIYTPLNIACKFGYLDIVKYLIENGADVNKHENKPISDSMTGFYDNWTPLMHAVYYNRYDIIKYLVENDADIYVQCPDTVLHRVNTIKILKYLLSKKANCNLICLSTGYSPLIWAIGPQNIEFIKLLIQYGANVNFKSKGSHYRQSKTPLSKAKETDCFELINLLKDNGATLE